MSRDDVLGWTFLVFFLAIGTAVGIFVAASEIEQGVPALTAIIAGAINGFLAAGAIFFVGFHVVAYFRRGLRSRRE